jgi:hypothetical protein
MAKQQLSTNTYGVAKWIVSPTASDGTHTTITAATAAASSGDTIFIRPGTYTENFTAKPGVNYTAFVCDSLTPNVIINGTVTMSGAGTCAFSGISFQTNSAFAIVVSGSGVSILYLDNCSLNCTNNTGISFTNSNAGSQINIYRCEGYLGTTGIALWSSSSTGTISISYSGFSNAGASTTVSSNSAGAVNIYYSTFISPISTSSTGGMSLFYSMVDTGGQNTTTLTLNGTGVTNLRNVWLAGGAGACIVAGGGTTISLQGITSISSTNSHPISGAGTVQYSAISFTDGSTNSVTSAISSDVLNVGTLTLNNPLALAYGGTNATSMTNTDGVVYYDGTRLVTTAVGTATQVLTSNGAGVAPTFQAAGGGGGGFSAVNIQKFTTAGTFTYTPTASTAYALIQLVGGGAGGAGGNGGGCGGNSGAYCVGLLTAAQIGASKTVVIGAGGASSSGVPNAGAISTFGAILLVAAGGTAGAGGSQTGGFVSNPSTTAALATGTDLTYGINGLGGGSGTGFDFGSGTFGYWGGTGGSNPLGAGGGSTTTTDNGTPVNGYAGQGFGSGGSGGAGNTANGGAGAVGACIITEFIT